MIRNAKRMAALGATLTQLLVPAAAIGTALVATSCVTSKGPSNVSQGRLYVSGDPTYDNFFDNLYQMQVALAQAPDRERIAREKLATALAVPASSSPQTIGEALAKRAEDMHKSGVGLKVTVTALDDPTGSPVATVSATPQPTDEKDRAFVTQLTETASAEARLLGDVRKAKGIVDNLRSQVLTLEPGVDTTFRHGGLRKRSEVSKNIQDAKTIMSLMAVRTDEVERATGALLANLTQAAHYEAPPPPPPPPPPSEEGRKKKRKKGGTEKPGSAAPAPKPASPDFEP